MVFFKVKRNRENIYRYFTTELQNIMPVRFTDCKNTVEAVKLFSLVSFETAGEKLQVTAAGRKPFAVSQSLPDIKYDIVCPVNQFRVTVLLDSIQVRYNEQPLKLYNIKFSSCRCG